jgi:mono/diheme cytochrome c family protein
MSKTQRVIITVLFISLVLVACGEAPEASDIEKNAEVATLARPEPPAEYAKMSAVKLNQADLEEGRRLFLTNCQSCHGEKGMADGPAAGSLNPKPQPLAETASGLSDAYLYWRISEGGQMEPFRSAMPAWMTILKEKQIWQIIGYLRQL